MSYYGELKKKTQKLSTENSWTKLLVNCFLEVHFLFLCVTHIKSEEWSFPKLNTQIHKTCKITGLNISVNKRVEKYF